MPKRIVDGPGIWESHKIRQVHPPELRAEFANLIPLATANGVFECCEYQIYSKVYSFNRDGWSPEKVRTMLDEFERVKLLFRWVDAAGKKYGFWVGIDKKGRLPSRKRQDEKHEATGPEVPADLLDKYLSTSTVAHQDVTATNREPYREPNGQSWLHGTGFGTGLGKGEGTGTGIGQDTSTPLSLPLLDSKPSPHGQDKSQELKSLLTELVYVCDGESLFNKKCQRQLSEKLKSCEPEYIVNLWREYWAEIKPGDSKSWRGGAADRFCKTLVEDFGPLVSDPDLEVALEETEYVRNN